MGGRLGGGTRGGGRADGGGEDGRRGRCAFAFAFTFALVLAFGAKGLPTELVLEPRRFANLRAEDKRREWAMEDEDGESVCCCFRSCSRCWGGAKKEKLSILTRFEDADELV